MPIPSPYKLFFPICKVELHSVNQVLRDSLNFGYPTSSSSHLIYLPEEDRFGKIDLPSYEVDRKSATQHFKSESGVYYANLFEHGEGNYINLGWFFIHSIPRSLGTLYRKSIAVRLASRWTYPAPDSISPSSNFRNKFALASGMVRSETLFRGSVGSTVIRVDREDIENTIQDFHAIQINGLKTVDLEVTLINPTGETRGRRTMVSVGEEQFADISSFVSESGQATLRCTMISISKIDPEGDDREKIDFIMDSEPFSQSDLGSIYLLGKEGKDMGGSFSWRTIRNDVLAKTFNSDFSIDDFYKNAPLWVSKLSKMHLEDDSLMVGVVNPGTLSSFVRMYCETDDERLIERMIGGDAPLCLNDYWRTQWRSKT